MSRTTTNSKQRRFDGVIILGPYRSGTSLTARVLAMLGIDFGPADEMHGSSPHNPGGYFERADVNDANDAFIFSVGRDLANPGDPVELARRGDPALLRTLDLRWISVDRTWGIKDPRMCFTLWAWLELGVIPRDKLAIVHVERSLDTSTRSGLKDHLIPSYCDGTEQGIRQMLARYTDHAQWHVQQLQLPTLHIRYEDLIGQPPDTVKRIADFLGIADPYDLKRATSVIGKKRHLFLFYAHRYLVKAPLKVLRILVARQKLKRRPLPPA